MDSMFIYISYFNKSAQARGNAVMCQAVFLSEPMEKYFELNKRRCSRWSSSSQSPVTEKQIQLKIPENI